MLLVDLGPLLELFAAAVLVQLHLDDRLLVVVVGPAARQLALFQVEPGWPLVLVGVMLARIPGALDLVDARGRQPCVLLVCAGLSGQGSYLLGALVVLDWRTDARCFSPASGQDVSILHFPVDWWCLVYALGDGSEKLQRLGVMDSRWLVGTFFYHWSSCLTGARLQVAAGDSHRAGWNFPVGGCHVHY